MDSQEFEISSRYLQGWLGEGHLPVLRGLQLAHKLQGELCNGPPLHLYMEEAANKTGLYTHDLLRRLLEIVSSLNDGILQLSSRPQPECTAPLEQLPSHIHHLKSQPPSPQRVARALTKRSPSKLINTRRRLPKVELKVRRVSHRFDDGFTWHKYGQKSIRGKQHPRSYYRCIHKGDLDCPALRQVQQCDGVDSCFDITYIAEHTCHGQIYSNEEQRTPILNRAAPLLPSAIINCQTGSRSTQELNARRSEPLPRVCGAALDEGVLQDTGLAAFTANMLYSMLVEQDPMLAPPRVADTPSEGTADNGNFNAPADQQHEAHGHDHSLPPWDFDQLFPAFADFKSQL